MNKTTFVAIIHAIEHLEVQHHNFKKNFGHILTPQFLAEHRDTIAIENLKELLYKEFKGNESFIKYFMEKSGFGRLCVMPEGHPMHSAESLYDYIKLSS